jgi:hypothetical protein
MPSISIHTLDARDNLMLEIVRDEFSLSPVQIQREIHALAHQTAEILSTKGISYSKLRNALVPQADRREAILVFDTAQTQAGFYGAEVFEHVLPLFNKKSSQSVLAGDYLGRSIDQDKLYEKLVKDLVGSHSSDYRHSSQYFFVYVNNLTDMMVDHFHGGLMGYLPYVGYIDVTFASWMKAYASTILMNSFLLHRGYALMAHEEDVPNEENYNVKGYAFEENGFKVRSLQPTFFDILLSYKIERPVLPGFESDSEFALSTISVAPEPLPSLHVRVESAKLGYLLQQKGRNMKRAGLLSVTAEELAVKIRDKLQSNYIYNISYAEQFDTAKFNVLIELPDERGNPVRMTVALKYLPDERAVSLITMF